MRYENKTRIYDKHKSLHQVPASLFRRKALQLLLSISGCKESTQYRGMDEILVNTAPIHCTTKA